MPQLELAAGQVLTAAHTNTYWMRQVLATGLSSARPTGYEGRAVYDTDTDALNIYASATTGWRPPWNLPWGTLGLASVTTTQSGITAITDLAGLSVAVTVPANRRLRITANTIVTSTVYTDPAELSIREGTTVLKQANGYVNGAAGATLSAEVVIAPSAGSHTYKVSLARGFLATGNVESLANTPYPAQIVVEDIGPAAAPA